MMYSQENGKQKVGMPGKIDQVLTGRNGAKIITKQGKQQIPTPDKFEVLNEAERERFYHNTKSKDKSRSILKGIRI